MYDILNNALRYDPATGQFWWRNPGRKRRMHEPAGSRTAAGFTLISVAGYRFLGHRLAWMLTHKAWPTSNLEHINGDRTDNRIENLREVTRSEAVHNTGMWDSNTSGTNTTINGTTTVLTGLYALSPRTTAFANWEQASGKVTLGTGNGGYGTAGSITTLGVAHSF
jgi:hypothetical protein